VTDPTDAPSFKSLGVNDPLCRALEHVGYERPTPIQGESIAPLLAGRDLLGVAQTGTGKTAAFALPILQHLSAGGRLGARSVRALILAPTRELAIQINDDVAAYGRFVELRQAVIFGGVGQHQQVKALSRGVDVLVATPGRLLDLMGQGLVDLRRVEALVLDEADRLLDMGFVRDVRKIVAQTPDRRQSILFSATMPKEVIRLARDLLREPVHVDLAPKKLSIDQIDQRVFMVETQDKRAKLESLLRDPAVRSAIVFTRTKHRADRIAKQLDKSGIAATALHGNKSQNARQRALESFKTGHAWVLVATDIAGRGIDIEGVTHVINFELPDEAESYVHRIGRTGRAGASGVAWSLCDGGELAKLRNIEKVTRQQIERDGSDPAPAPRPVSRGNEARANGSADQPPKRRRRRPRKRPRQQAA
jgi:ATP-dependent RNA helicase RhlE